MTSSSIKSQRGRKSKYTTALVKEICGYIEEGSNAREACMLVDISHDTFYRWKTDKSEFSDAIENAEAKCKLFHIRNIKKASNKNWRASAWWLEHRYPQDFSVHRPIPKPEKSLEERSAWLDAAVEEAAKPYTDYENDPEVLEAAKEFM